MRHLSCAYYHLHVLRDPYKYISVVTLNGGVTLNIWGWCSMFSDVAPSFAISPACNLHLFFILFFKHPSSGRIKKVCVSWDPLLSYSDHFRPSYFEFETVLQVDQKNLSTLSIFVCLTIKSAFTEHFKEFYTLNDNFLKISVYKSESEPLVESTLFFLRRPPKFWFCWVPRVDKK